MSRARGCPLCGVVGCPRAAEAVTIPVKPKPTVATVARHLREDHRIPLAVLDTASTTEHVAWHDAEHRTRTPHPDADGNEKGRHRGHLRHLHPVPAKKAKS